MTSVPSINSKKINLKLIILFLLFFLFLIPKLAIYNIVNERKNNEWVAQSAVAKDYGDHIIVGMPKIIIPFKEKYADKKTKEVTLISKVLTINAARVDISSELETSKLKKGIFKIPVIKSQTDCAFYFNPIEFKSLRIDSQLVQFEKAILIVEIQDSKTISRSPKITLSTGGDVTLLPGLSDLVLRGNGMHTLLDDYSGGEISGKMQLYLRGTGGISFRPNGQKISLDISGDYPHPNFQGNYAGFSPNERTVTEHGFEAKWLVNEFNFQEAISKINHEETISNISLSSSVQGNYMGVSLQVVDSHYQKTDRSVKYMFLIVGLVFIIFFITEIIHKIYIHPIQYIMVGLAIALFFLLLLSGSEWIGYNLAYLFSSILVSGLIGLYSKVIYPKVKQALLLFLSLISLFLILYIIILSLEYALLLGTTLLFLLLGIVMYITRNIKWANQ